MSKNSLTIFVLTYNRPKFLRQTLESILNQSYEDFIVHVLDNASDEETENVVKSFDDERVAYTRHQKNIGIVANTQYALTNCKTDFLVIFHDDDIMESNFIKTELDFMVENEDVDVIVTNAMKIDSNNNPLDLYSKDERDYVRYEKDDYIDTYLKYRKSFITPSAMYRMSFIRDNSIELNMEVGPCADVVLFIDISNAGGVIVETNKPLMKYRVHNSQESSVSSMTMHCELINYLHADEHYSRMMVEKKKFEDMYYLASSKAALLEYIRDNISRSDRETLLHRYREVIVHNRINEFLIKMCKVIFDVFPHISRIIVRKYAEIKKI